MQMPSSNPFASFLSGRRINLAWQATLLIACVAQAPSDCRCEDPEKDVGLQHRLSSFDEKIGPALRQACVDCHGPDLQEGAFRVDTMDPDMVNGDDVQWWVEVLGVLIKNEMPPEDAPELGDTERTRIIQWLSDSTQAASIARRQRETHSSFRRMTSYETNYALQDLLGVSIDFAADLPPEPRSEDGFQNSSETLHMTVMQFEAYRQLATDAIGQATTRGPRPDPVRWLVTMEDASGHSIQRRKSDFKKRLDQLADRPEALAAEIERQQVEKNARPRGPYYIDTESQTSIAAKWNYRGAQFAHDPVGASVAPRSTSTTVAVVPAGQRLHVELGNQLPESGPLRVRMRASRTAEDLAANPDRIPSVQWEFGWQASNNSSAGEILTPRSTRIDAPPDEPAIYEWDLSLDQIKVRNPLRRTAVMGKTPNPSEFLKLRNSSVVSGTIKIDYIEVIARDYPQWPPAPHTSLLMSETGFDSETDQARAVLERLMRRAWRREVSDDEVRRKLDLFEQIRPTCDDFQHAITEVLANVLASPPFLYLRTETPVLLHGANGKSPPTRDAYQLATDLAIFLWCSFPDDELLQLASNGDLRDEDVLIEQTDRMLADPRSGRFAHHFVRQWLGMQLLDYLKVSEKAHRGFNEPLRAAMQREPVELFRYMIRENRSVIDFIDAEYTIANERLARHYFRSDVLGNHFRRVDFDQDPRRGGLLTAAGLLAMNSDGTDSHPLKRGIWLLESILNDPPPPPPPAVPEIDLADPEIAKLTLKERIEDHRNDVACMSCHQKIDPWGIAFENYDAVGSWRTEIGDVPVDASSQLPGNVPLNGIVGLKKHLVDHRQDQFAAAIVHKLTTFALGRPLNFSDRAELSEMTSQLRNQGDGLADLVRIVVTSDLFQNR